MQNATRSSSLPMVQQVSAVLWPSFILAGIATGVFFSVFDPLDLMACTGEPPFTRIGAYSVGFFLFWVLAATSSLSTLYFLRPCSVVNPEEHTEPR